MGGQGSQALDFISTEPFAWVAVLEAEERIAGSGRDAVEAKEEAERNGYPDILVMRVRATDKRYALRELMQYKHGSVGRRDDHPVHLVLKEGPGIDLDRWIS